MPLLDPGGSAFTRKKKRKPAFPNMLDPETVAELAPGASVIPGTPAQSWTDLIKADPLYQQALGGLQADDASAAAGRAAAVRQALIRMGLVTPGMIDQLKASLSAIAPDLAADIDPGTLDLANQNQNSIAAQMKAQHEKNVVALEDVLAAKGILRSGQTGYELGEEQKRLDQEGYDAINSLTDLLSGVYRDYAEGVKTRQGLRNEAGEAAMSRLLGMGAEPAPATPATTTAPPTSAALARQLRRNRRRPIRRPIGGYE